MSDWIKYLKDKKLIAIDPGKAGGIAVYSLDRGEVVDLVSMPETPQDLLEFIKIMVFYKCCQTTKERFMLGLTFKKFLVLNYSKKGL